MKNKKLIGTLLATSIAFSATLTGCSFVTSNNAADYEQVIAEVNISSADNLSERDSELISKYKDAVGTSSIIKRDLVAYYVNVGYSYQSNYGTSSAEIFNMLLDSLIETSVLTQYAVMYLLDYKAGDGSATTVLNEFNAKATYTEKLEYLLTDENAEDGDKDKEIKIAKYSLYSSINSAIDSVERDLLEEHDETSGTGSRTTPTGVNTEKDGYYPKKANGDLDYNVYTGYAGYQLNDSGAYKEDAHESSTKATRIKAYNTFMASLIRNSLVDPEKDDLRDIVNGVEYIKNEYASQLENRVINKYYDLYEKEQEAKLTAGDYDYLNIIYNDLLAGDKSSYEKASSFSSAMDNVSDTSFVLYSPNTEGEGTFGYVYNILLPFDAVQNIKLSEYQADFADSDNGDYTIAFYQKRNELLKQIKTTDQRSAWFNGSTDYSFNVKDYNEKNQELALDYYAGENNDREYLFFENNLIKTDRYDPIEKYIGQYAYNGKVYEKENGGYWLVPNTLTIDDMLDEFVNYVNYVLGDDGKAAYVPTENYYEKLTENTFYSDEDKKEINYDNFIYAEGKVNFAQTIDEKTYRGNLLNKESAQYKALAAVNELQYAYTTDTSVLSQYLGYSVSLGDTTGYIKEFETAAHKALAEGAGAFNVCAGNYGWHLIYVTYTFGTPETVEGKVSSAGGEEYAPDWSKNVNVEGTFENMFFEWVKSSAINDISTTRRTQLINQFNKDNTVTKFEKRYKDLLELDS